MDKLISQHHHKFNDEKKTDIAIYRLLNKTFSNSSHILLRLKDKENRYDKNPFEQFITIIHISFRVCDCLLQFPDLERQENIRKEQANIYHHNNSRPSKPIYTNHHHHY